MTIRQTIFNDDCATIHAADGRTFEIYNRPFPKGGNDFPLYKRQGESLDFMGYLTTKGYTGFTREGIVSAFLARVK